MSHDAPTTPTPPAPRSLHAAAALWASAFILAGLVLTQASRLPGALAQSQSGTVASVGELTILSADTGAGEDFVLVLDSVSESIFVYTVEQRTSVELVQAYDLDRLFVDARSRAGLPNRP